MDPRKFVMAAAVVGMAAGCSGAAAGHRAAAVGTRPAPVTTPATLPPAPIPTTTAATITTTAAPTTTTTLRRAPSVTAAASSTSATTAPCPANLASSLAYTGSAHQLVTVVAAGWETSAASVTLWERSGRCWALAGGPWAGYIGQNGFSDHKIEGDGTTPTGIYGLGAVMYGNAADPGAREPYHQLVCGDWWDEDPQSPAYNTFQHVSCDGTPPFGGGSEALWKETGPYPSFAVIDYNTSPVVKGAGSAIFFHAATGGPTVGCVSVPLDDLDQALSWLSPGDSPAFVMGPANEITRF